MKQHFSTANEIFLSIPKETIDKDDVLDFFTFSIPNNEAKSKASFERALETALDQDFHT